MFKRTLVFLLTASFSYIAQAQIDTSSLTPVKKDKQFVFGLNTNSAGFTFKKYCTNTVAMRIGVSGFRSVTESGDVTESSYTLSNQVYISNPDDANDIYSKSSQNSFAFSVGLQKSFLVQKRFEPYVGFDLVVANNSKSNETSSVSYNSNGGFTYDRYVNRSKSTTTHAYNFGLNALIGFNYYIIPRFALGAEFWVTPLSVNYNGKTVSESSYINTTTPQTYSSSSMIKKGGGSISGNFNGVVRITATVFLNKRE